ncbi:hypothetical protein IW967_06070 [Alicyclobacillus mali]|uniref:Uncharacterized protein n=1 Tax=Alicyclobacillus mali (ex Roth et al. 2021) TaxID=1123961 RepID=A0ABS0F2B8_9BACL|nr:hypothetical protein [Alicyclobacillus mali (ex Roth et al. 2021)]MBF8377440.1 hypothetical protein [Alicyclobacillus mali (ex Roth et al. 2021)]MCL6487408.1 hypothetical protein [Alicyclobacillus mali (ex Roth et al. 2021)]
MTEREEALLHWTNRASSREDVRRFVFEAYMDIALADMLDAETRLESEADVQMERD